MVGPEPGPFGVQQEAPTNVSSANQAASSVPEAETEDPSAAAAAPTTTTSTSPEDLNQTLFGTDEDDVTTEAAAELTIRSTIPKQSRRSEVHEAKPSPTSATSDATVLF